MFVTITMASLATLVVGAFLLYYQIGTPDSRKVKGTHSLTLMDFTPAIVAAVVVFILLTAFRVGITANATADWMTINSVVTKKYKDAVSCSHSYSCNCRVVMSSDGKTSSTTCDTCYEHNEDYDWVVKSDIGKTYINRIDRQGDEEPPRWKMVEIGEPYSTQIRHTNYLKSSPLSVFKDYEEFDKVIIPERPNVYDYYRIKHTVNFNSSWTKGINEIDKLLTTALSKTSPVVKANVVVIFYGGDDKILQATKVRTYGGRINDQTIMVKVEPDGKIINVYPFSWTLNNMVNVKLRDDIMGLGNLNGKSQEFVNIINENMKKYYSKRKNDAHDYLRYNMVFPTWFYVMCGIFPFLGIVAVILVNRNT